MWKGSPAPVALELGFWFYLLIDFLHVGFPFSLKVAFQQKVTFFVVWFLFFGFGGDEGVVILCWLSRLHPSLL